MQFTGLPLHDALPMVTSVPAEALRLTGIKGTLAPMADADIVLLDRDLSVKMTIVGGRVVYQKEQA